jgi:hypothetical protein
MNPGASPVFLTSGRTIAPYVYEQYFPNAEWLKHIKPENCRFTVQLGSVVTPLMTFELTKDSLMHHPTFEVAALSLDPEDEERFMSANASNPTPFLLPASLYRDAGWARHFRRRRQTPLRRRRVEGVHHSRMLAHSWIGQDPNRNARELQRRWRFWMRTR